MANTIDPAVRSDRVLIDQLADKWALDVLGALCAADGCARFNAIKRAVPTVSQKMLAQCLRRLERSGLVERRVLDTPLGVEYRFTPLGYTLEAPVLALLRWTADYADAVREAQSRFDAAAERKAAAVGIGK